jgi:spore maturation protein SpmA
MALNYIWVAFFLISFAVALVKLVFFQNAEVFPAMMNSTFDMAKTGFEISIALTGVMSLWLGLMKIGERGGIIPIFSRLVGPFFSRLFPEVPRDHPATGAIIMNFSANMLGLDNAATPLGLKAMTELQKLNPDKDTASNAQIMFIVLNTSGLTIIPLTIIADRTAMGAANPTSVFIPALMATFCSTMAAFIYLSIKQRIRIDRVVATYILGITAIVGTAAWYASSLPQEELLRLSTLVTGVTIMSVITLFMVLGLRKKIHLFDTFIDGAKEGFETSIKIIPFLVAILVGIGVFRASGTLDYITGAVKYMVGLFNVNTDFVDALPVALLRPLSGQGSRAMMIELAKTHGPDSFVGNLACIFRGCMETTFYVIALYYGSVNIRKMRYTLAAGLIADAAGVIAAILIGYMFFH